MAWWTEFCCAALEAGMICLLKAAWTFIFFEYMWT